MATTNECGVYILVKLKPGLYTIVVEAQHFKRSVREGIQLATGERVRLDLELLPSNLTESITITADASLLRTETSSLGQVIGQRKIVDMPLNGRSFVQLITLAPGVTAPPGPAFPRINGGRPRVNEYLFDSISVLQPEPGQVAFFPIPDAIQEFKVETNIPSADFERFNGGVINLTTKSATNEWHGAVFEFFRHDALNRRNLFAPATVENPRQPVFRHNQYGFVLGGPIPTGRTFFVGDYQGTRQLLGRVRISTVPTLLQRQVIFTKSIAGIVPHLFDPATTRANGSSSTPVTHSPITSFPRRALIRWPGCYSTAIHYLRQAAPRIITVVWGTRLKIKISLMYVLIIALPNVISSLGVFLPRRISMILLRPCQMTVEASPQGLSARLIISGNLLRPVIFTHSARGLRTNSGSAIRAVRCSAPADC